jgi:hypothetical protein
MNTSLFSFDPSLLQQAITDAVSTAVREVLAEQKPAAPTAPPPDLLSRAETRQLLHVSNTTLHVWEKKGMITPARAGRRVLFRRSDIDRLLSDTPNVSRRWRR